MQTELEEVVAAQEEPPRDGFYKVVGAGLLHMLTSCRTRCGKATGISVGASWGSHGNAGGVMDFAEIKRLVADLQAFVDRFEADEPTEVKGG